MSEKLKVGILGGTGMVGQRFISLLENHPWFEVTTIAASPRSAGKTYEQAVGDRWKMDTPMPEAVKNIVVMNVNEVEKVAAEVDFVFSAVDMTKEEIKKIEEDYAKTETPVVSNNSAHRWTPDVPMVVPEVNPEHMEVIKYPPALPANRNGREGCRTERHAGPYPYPPPPACGNPCNSIPHSGSRFCRQIPTAYAVYPSSTTCFQWQECHRPH